MTKEKIKMLEENKNFLLSQDSTLEELMKMESDFKEHLFLSKELGKQIPSVVEDNLIREALCEMHRKIICKEES